MRTKRILASLLVLGLVVSAVTVGSSAFFSDTETSENNVLQAGSIDLLIDNHSYYYGPSESWELNPDLTWDLANLGTDVPGLFFNYSDLKPGDQGEDTISIHVNDNPAWLCSALRVDVNDENVAIDPELDAGDDVDVPEDLLDGELANELSFAFWLDDGDNVWEDDEWMLTYGPAADAINGLKWAISDSSQESILPEPTNPDETYYIGKYWCYGAIETFAEVQDDLIDRGPDVRNASGFLCSGEPVSNVSQTDRVEGDVVFYAVQERHNAEFVCSDWDPRPAEELPEAEVAVATGWSEVDLDANGGGQGKEWFAKARNNNGGFEVAVGLTDGGPSQDTDDTTWVAGVSNPFTLSYDGAGNASLTAGGTTVTYAVGTQGYGRIGINVKAPATVTTTVDSLSLDVAAPLATDTVSVVGGNAVSHLTISGVNLDQAWTLTGNFTFSDVGGAYPDEYPAVQFSMD